jgi:hypothetical protein
MIPDQNPQKVVSRLESLKGDAQTELVRSIGGKLPRTKSQKKRKVLGISNLDQTEERQILRGRVSECGRYQNKLAAVEGRGNRLTNGI